MKIIEEKIEIFDITFRVAHISDKKDLRCLKDSLSEWDLYDLASGDIEDFVEGIRDGGNLYSNYRKKVFFMIIWNSTSLPSLIDLVSHESRHLEDRILKLCNIDDLETAAYLSGYIAKKIFPIIDEYILKTTKRKKK